MNTNIGNIKIMKEKDINNSFLVIKNVSIDKDAYEYKILEEEKIEGTLEYRVDREEGKIVLKYDIKGAVALDDYLKINRLKKKDIIFIIENIKKLLENIENYLISENSILLDPRSIFLIKKDDKMEIKFCMIPCLISDFSYELSKLLIRILRQVDASDKSALNMAYALFMKSSMKNYSISDLMTVIDEAKINDKKEDKMDTSDACFNYDSFLEACDENHIEEEAEEVDLDEIFGEKEIAAFKKEENLENINYEEVMLDDETKEALGIKIFNDISSDTDVKKETKKLELPRIKLLPERMKVSYIILPILSVITPLIAYFLLGRKFFINHILLLVVYEVLIVLIISLNSLIENLYTE